MLTHLALIVIFFVLVILFGSGRWATIRPWLCFLPSYDPTGDDDRYPTGGDDDDPFFL